MTDPAFSICVYLGSRPGENPAFTDAAIAVGNGSGAMAANWCTEVAAAG